MSGTWMYKGLDTALRVQMGPKSSKGVATLPLAFDKRRLFRASRYDNELYEPDNLIYCIHKCVVYGLMGLQSGR